MTAYDSQAPHDASCIVHRARPVARGDLLASKYRVEEVLGAGGMGVVVAAMHLDLDQRVALKFLLPGAAVRQRDRCGDVRRRSSARREGMLDRRRRSTKNTTPGSLGSLVFALREIDLGIEHAVDAGADGGADAGPAGLDLDERMTSDLASSSCTFPKDSPTISEYGMDLACGVDNASRNLVKLMAVSSAAMRPENINARLLGGYFGFAVAVDDWNGATDDEHVIVRAFPTLGIGQLLPDGGVLLQATPPALAPSDVWVKDRRFARLSDASSLTSDHAWVKTVGSSPISARSSSRSGPRRRS